MTHPRLTHPTAYAVGVHAAQARLTGVHRDRAFHFMIGLVAIVVPLLYLRSDALQVLHGGHTAVSHVLTYLGEAPTVFFILGLYAVQWARSGWLGLGGAGLYGYAFIFWAGFTLYGLFTAAPGLPALAASVGAFY